MRLFRVVLLIAFISVSGFTALVYWKSEQIVAVLLKKVGCPGSVDGIRAGLSGINIEALDIACVLQSGTLRVSLKNVSIGYNPGLLIKGKIESGNIHSALIELPQSQSAPSSTTRFEIPKVPEEIILPFNQFIIEDLTVKNLPRGISVQGVRASLDVSEQNGFKDGKILLSFADKEEPGTSFNCAIARSSKESLSVECNEGGDFGSVGGQVTIKAPQENLIQASGSMHYNENSQALTKVVEVFGLSRDVVPSRTVINFDAFLSGAKASGTLAAGTSLVWNNSSIAQDPKISIELKNPISIEGDFENRSFALKIPPIDASVLGMTIKDLSANLNYSQNPKAASPFVISAEEINAGASFNKIKLQGAIYADKQVRIESAQTLFLDAEVSTSKVTIGPKFYPIQFPVKIDGLSLARIAELYGTAGLTLTGIVDGTIPVEVRKEGIKVDGGVVTARKEGGIIQYARASDVDTGDSRGTLVARILKHIDYSSLQATVKYTPRGDLTLGVSIRGRSPELNKDQDVNVNLNVEENLPTFLKALRFAKGDLDFLKERDL